jgi:hypothetical protein
VHRGEHEPILTRDLFEAMQDRRAATKGGKRSFARRAPGEIDGAKDD